MKSELETVKVIHIDGGFPWRYEIMGSPDGPEIAIVIKHYEEGKMIEEVTIPMCAIENLKEALSSF
jgi:hypothetical protein